MMNRVHLRQLQTAATIPSLLAQAGFAEVAATFGRRGFWVLALLLLVTLSGCQAMRPAATGPTRTPILLAAQAPSTAVPARPAATLSAAPASPSPAATPTATSPAAAAVKSAPALTVTVTRAARIMALGTRPTIVLRDQPAAGARVAAQLAGSAVLWAAGRSADGRWLWMSYGDQGATAWAAAADVNVLGDAQSLPVIGGKQAARPPTESKPASQGQTPARQTPAGSAGANANRPAATRPLPGYTGRLAFQAASGGDIYVVNADGTGLRRVTDGIDPALSPDGTQLAFARWSASPHGVFVIDLTSGEERRIASANRPRGPAWSRDGSKVAFTHTVRSISCRATPFGCIDEGQLRAQFRGQECIPSPAGQLCIGDFPVQQVDETGISQVTPDGQNWLDLGALGDAQSPSWNPQQDELLYRGGAGLQITAPNQDSREVLRDPSISSPAWSPDGQRIAVQKRLHNNTEIYLLDAAGKELARLTAPASGAGRAPHNVAPAWSPDGRSILFLSDRDGAWRLYRMNPDGSGQAPFLPAVLGPLSFKYDFAAERVVSWSR
jgi:dipeptidyl aminopeptidase/acylaminoacyl peptidase